MNRNNRLYTIDSDGEKHFTAAGLLLQFWVLSEGSGPALSDDERQHARYVVDKVMDTWHDVAAIPAPRGSLARRLPTGIPASQMNDGQLMQVIDTIEEACAAVGAALVFEIIYPLYSASAH
ncbi:hypothetical protein [Massilia sp. PWRC2]|uniref:hypothetical protein n=1 Tax=Massilia sp. PWRC2 TaxID=2804626 RepID=UPI003CFB4490